MILADLAEPVAARGDAGTVAADLAAIRGARRVALIPVAEPVAARGMTRRAASRAELATIVGAARVVLAGIADPIAAAALADEVVMLRRGRRVRVVETGDDQDGAKGTQKTERSHGGISFRLGYPRAVAKSRSNAIARELTS